MPGEEPGLHLAVGDVQNGIGQRGDFRRGFAQGGRALHVAQHDAQQLPATKQSQMMAHGDGVA